MLSRKDYEAIAKIISDTRKAMDERCKWYHAINSIECKLIMYFADNNLHFNRQKFSAAAKLKL